MQRPPYIVCAAVKCGDVIFTGARHYDPIMNRQMDFAGREVLGPPAAREEGFIDQYGKFYTRSEALQTVINTGQPIDLQRNGCNNELYSEGLY